MFWEIVVAVVVGLLIFFNLPLIIIVSLYLLVLLLAFGIVFGITLWLWTTGHPILATLAGIIGLLCVLFFIKDL